MKKTLIRGLPLALALVLSLCLLIPLAVSADGTETGVLTYTQDAGNFYISLTLEETATEDGTYKASFYLSDGTLLTHTSADYSTLCCVLSKENYSICRVYATYVGADGETVTTPEILCTGEGQELSQAKNYADIVHLSYTQDGANYHVTFTWTDSLAPAESTGESEAEAAASSIYFYLDGAYYSNLTFTGKSGVLVIPIGANMEAVEIYAVYEDSTGEQVRTPALAMNSESSGDLVIKASLPYIAGLAAIALIVSGLLRIRRPAIDKISATYHRIETQGLQLVADVTAGKYLDRRASRRIARFLYRMNVRLKRTYSTLVYVNNEELGQYTDLMHEVNEINHALDVQSLKLIGMDNEESLALLKEILDSFSDRVVKNVDELAMVYRLHKLNRKNYH